MGPEPPAAPEATGLAGAAAASPPPPPPLFNAPGIAFIGLFVGLLLGERHRQGLRQGHVKGQGQKWRHAMAKWNWEKSGANAKFFSGRHPFPKVFCVGVHGVVPMPVRSKSAPRAEVACGNDSNEKPKNPARDALNTRPVGTHPQYHRTNQPWSRRRIGWGCSSASPSTLHAWHAAPCGLISRWSGSNRRASPINYLPIT